MEENKNIKRIVIPLEKAVWKKLRELSLEHEISMNRIMQIEIREIIKNFKKNIDRYRS